MREANGTASEEDSPDAVEVEEEEEEEEEVVEEEEEEVEEEVEEEGVDDVDEEVEEAEEEGVDDVDEALLSALWMSSSHPVEMASGSRSATVAMPRSAKRMGCGGLFMGGLWLRFAAFPAHGHATRF